MSIKKVLGAGLAFLLTLTPIAPQVAQAAETDFNLINKAMEAPAETVDLTIHKLMYEGEPKTNFITNNGKEQTWADTAVKAYEKANYGDVEFTVYEIPAAELAKIADDVTDQAIADAVETAATAEEATAIPYGATVVGSGGVDESGMLTVTGINNNSNNGYVIVETKSPATVVGKAKPMFIRLPMLELDGASYQAGPIHLYPKNNVKKLEVEFIKYKQANADADKSVLEGAQFKLYKGEKGSGVVVKESAETDAKDLIFTTDAEGKITIPNLLVGKWYLVEQEVAGLIDGVQTEVTDGLARKDVGTFLVGGDAQNDASNVLSFEVKADGTIEKSPQFENYVNFERPELDKTNKSANATADLSTENKKSNYEIFEDISFNANLVIPKNAEDYSKLELKDTLLLDDAMTGHLEFVADSFEVKAGEVVLTEGTDYTINMNDTNNSFTINFIVNGSVSDAVKAAKSVDVAYKAQFLNVEGIVAAGAYKNKIELTYNNSQNNNTKDRFDRDEEEFTTYGFKVKKVNDGLWGTKAAPEALEGARFILLDSENNVFKGFKEDGTALFGADADDNYVLTSDAEGIVKLDGLRSGNYILREIQAPEGYRTPIGEAADTKITISNESHLDGKIADITNNRNDEFVITGREETIMRITTVGASLILVGALVVASRRKKEVTE